MFTITLKRQVCLRLIALATASFFFLSIFTSDVMALAPQSGAQNPYTRCEYQIACLLRSGQLTFAEKPEDIQFLEERNHAKALLLSHGKILAHQNLKDKPEELLRAIIHEQIEAIMQIMAKEERSKYSTLINMILGAKIRLPDKYLTNKERRDKKNGFDLKDAFIRFFPKESMSQITHTLLDDELLTNHMIAKAVELIIARNDNLLTTDMSEEESLFFRAIEDTINANKHNYFTGIFWDRSVRETNICIAMANGMKFHQVASSRDVGVDAAAGVPTNGTSPNTPQAFEPANDKYTVEFQTQHFDPPVKDGLQLLGPKREVYFTVGFGQSVARAQVKGVVHYKNPDDSASRWVDAKKGITVVNDYGHGYFRLKAVIPPRTEEYTFKVSPNSGRSWHWLTWNIQSPVLSPEMKDKILHYHQRDANGDEALRETRSYYLASEDKINRGLSAIRRLYGDRLESAIKSIAKGKTVRLLFIGAGRGKEILDLMNLYPNIEVYSINREPDLIYDFDHIKSDPVNSNPVIRARLFCKLHEHHFIRDISAGNNLSDLPHDFDIIVFGWETAYYIHDILQVLKKLYAMLKTDGLLFAPFYSWSFKLIGLDVTQSCQKLAEDLKKRPGVLIINENYGPRQHMRFTGIIRKDPSQPSLDFPYIFVQYDDCRYNRYRSYRITDKEVATPQGASPDGFIMQGDTAALITPPQEPTISEIVKDAIIGKGEMYPMGGEVVSAIEGDETYIITRVPDEFLNRKGLEVWLYSDLTGAWGNTVKMEKLVKDNPQDDRFIGKIKLNRAGTVQYTCHWLVRENGDKTSEGWSTQTAPFKNGCFLVRQKKDLVEEDIGPEEKITILEAFRAQARAKGINPHLFERKINYRFIKDAVQNRQALRTLRFEWLPPGLRDAANFIFRIETVIDSRLKSMDYNFQPSAAQKEAVREASAILSEFYGSKIDLSPLVLWGNLAGAGTVSAMHNFILINGEEHDKAKLKISLIHEFLHQFEGRGKLYCGPLEESIIDYLAMVIYQDNNLENYCYQGGIKLIAILVELIGFEKMYRFFRDTDFKVVEDALGKNGEKVLRVLLQYFFTTNEDIKPQELMLAQEVENYQAEDLRELLANRDNAAYLASFEKEARLKRKEDRRSEGLTARAGFFKYFSAGSERLKFLISHSDNGFKIYADKVLKIRSERKEMSPKNLPLPLPVLQMHMKKVREEWRKFLAENRTISDAPPAESVQKPANDTTVAPATSELRIEITIPSNGLPDEKNRTVPISPDAAPVQDVADIGVPSSIMTSEIGKYGTPFVYEVISKNPASTRIASTAVTSPFFFNCELPAGTHSDKIEYVVVAGDWNDWDVSGKQEYRLTCQGSRWSGELQVPVGKHEYKFVYKLKDREPEWIPPGMHNNLWCYVDTSNLMLGEREFGEKGASLQELINLGIPVPHSRLITVEEAKNIRANQEPLKNMIRELEEVTGARLGDSDKPLLLAVRSSSDRPYHGGLHSILWVGFTLSVLERMKQVDGETKALARYAVFLESYGNEVLAIPGNEFAEVRRREKDPRKIVGEYLKIIEDHGSKVPDDTRDQLLAACEAVVASGGNKRILDFRRAHGEFNPAPVGLIVSQMSDTFGENSGIGFVSTHDPRTGELMLSGEVVIGASGLDLMKGRDVISIEEFKRRFQRSDQALSDLLCKILDKRNGIPQDVEFIFNEAAEVKIAQAQAEQGLSPAALLRLAEESARREGVFIWEAIPRLITESRVEAVPQRTRWVVSQWGSWPEYTLMDRAHRLIGTKRQIQDIFHRAPTDPRPSSGNFLVGRLVWTTASASKYPQDPLVFLVAEGNQDELQNLLFGNRVSAVILPESMTLGAHIRQMMQYFGVPLIQSKTEEMAKIRLRQAEGSLVEGTRVIFHETEGIVGEMAVEGEEKVASTVLSDGTQAERVSFVAQRSEQERRMGWGDSYESTAYLRLQPTPGFDPRAIRREIRSSYGNKPDGEIIDAIHVQLFHYLISLETWEKDHTRMDAAGDAIEKGLKAALLFEILLERGKSREEILLDAAQKRVSDYMRRLQTGEDNTCSTPLSFGDGLLVKSNSYQVMMRVPVRFRKEPEKLESPVIAFWFHEYLFENAPAVSLPTPSQWGMIQGEARPAKAKAKRFIDFLAQRGEKIEGLSFYESYMRQPDNWGDAGIANMAASCTAVIGIQFRQETFRDVVRLLAEFEKSEYDSSATVILDQHGGNRRTSSEPETIMTEGSSKEWIDFIEALKALGRTASEEPIKRALELDKRCTEYQKTGQSLILYADDILENVTVYDLQHTIKNILAKHNTLAGGKIILFARKAVNAKILEDMIHWTSQKIKIETVLETALQTNGDELKEIDAVVRYAKAKNAKDVLAIIRGPAKNKDNYTPFREFAKNSKIPLVIVGPDKALYSLAQALSMAMDAKLSDGARTAWLIMLPSIRTFTEDIRKLHEQYKRTLEALRAA